MGDFSLTPSPPKKNKKTKINLSIKQLSLSTITHKNKIRWWKIKSDCLQPEQNLAHIHPPPPMCFWYFSLDLFQPQKIFTTEKTKKYRILICIGKYMFILVYKILIIYLQVCIKIMTHIFSNRKMSQIVRPKNGPLFWDTLVFLRIGIK